MPITPNGIYYPDLVDEPNGPGQMQALAVSVDTKVGALSSPRRIGGAAFATDLASDGTIERVGYSQTVNLVTGHRYRVWFNGYVDGGATAGQGRIQLRYDDDPLAVTSPAIGLPFGTICVSTSNPFSFFFFREFVATGTGPFHVGVGVRTGTGTGDTVIRGTIIDTEVTIDDVTQ